MAAAESGSAGRAVTRAFIVAITLGAGMVLMALGFMSLDANGLPDTVTLGIILVAFAVSFVASAVLLDRSGTGSTQSVIVGAILALGITVVALTVYCGAKYINDGMPTLSNGLMTPDYQMLLAGFALALIASAIIDRLVLKF